MRPTPLLESIGLPHGYPGPLQGNTPLSHDTAPITIPLLGLTLWVRLSPETFGGAASVIETMHAPGFGPPLHRHAETEVFRVLQGHYLMRLDERCFEIGPGDVITVPGGVPHAFVNLSERPSRQWVLITPGMHADVFFRELSALMADGPPERLALEAFGRPWGVEFLGPPLRADAVRAA